MKNTLFFAFVVLTGVIGTSVRRQEWIAGCYEKTSLENVTRVEEPVDGPNHCTYQCTRKGAKYAAVQGDSLCICLGDLRSFQKVDEARCNVSCTKLSHLKCGGHGEIVSIFHTTVPIIFNHSLTGPELAATRNSSHFVSNAWLTNSTNVSKSNFSSSDHAAANVVSATWTVDDLMVKSVRKRVTRLRFTDGLNFTFASYGMFKVCVNVSNGYIWVAECASVLAVEGIHVLEVVNIHGGKHTDKGKYAIMQTSYFHVDVIVNAGSFANLHFNFGDTLNAAEVKRNYQSTMKNCSCLALTRKTHLYNEKGSFSLNITAVNHVSRKELIFLDKITVDGKIEGCSITTKFVAAGKMTRVHLQTFGTFTFAHFHWTHPSNRQETTTVPFINVTFPNYSPQYRLKVSAFNNVSEADCTGQNIYIEPDIISVTLQTTVSQVTVNAAVIFTSTVTTDQVLFDSSLQYTWILGDGQVVQGTIPNLVYKYKQAGRFEVRVQAGNFLSKIYSNYVTVRVYEEITKVEIRYKPFKFGETTEFSASVADGTNMTYSWDFGDNVTLSTANGTVQHKYKRMGNFTVKLKVANPVSSKEDSIAVFVLRYRCQKPEVSFSRLPLEETTRKAQELRIDVDVNVSCSVSSTALYRWTVFSMQNGKKEEKLARHLGTLSSTLSQRSLVLPPNTLNPGTYLVQLVVEMKGTVVFTKISKRINVLPTEMRAVIRGGDVVSIGRKSHENVTLDASDSFDPDDNEREPLRFLWNCRSIIGNRHEPCFKPNVTSQLNWTRPVFEFLPKMLKTSASLFAFMVTASNDNDKSATAFQFVKVENGEMHRLLIECPECHNPDVNPHNQITFTGICSDCENTSVAFKWKVYMAPKVKVFLRLFGKCIPADGKAWDSQGNLNETNSTTTATIPTTSSTPLTTVTKAITTKPTEKTQGADFQRLICEMDLNNIRINSTSLVRISRKRREVLEELNIMTKQGTLRKSDQGHTENWDDFDFDSDNDIVTDDLFLKDNNEVPAASRFTKRVKRNTDRNNVTFQSSASGQGGPMPGRNFPSNPRSGLTYSSGTGAVQSDDDTSSSGGSGFPQASGSGRGNTGGGTGSGRPNSLGSGRGCEGSVGVAGGRGAGSGSGTVGGCSGGYGEGAKANQNKTGGTNSTENGDKTTGTSGDLISKSLEEQLEGKLNTIREIMHPTEVDTHSRLQQLILTKGSLVPGQLYMVEFIAVWQSGAHERIAGEAKSYFLTNTGPFLGSCHVTPQTGVEAKTTFTLHCQHWKDKHHPLKFFVQYKVHSQQRPTWLYYGLKETLNFTLPAGEKSNDNIIELEISAEDAEGVKTKLCPIQVTVMPLENTLNSIEEYLYNQSIGNVSPLKVHEDLLDEVSASIFITTATNSINRLLSVMPGSTKHKLRLQVRRRLLESLSKFPVQTEAYALQQSRMIRALMYKPSEVSSISVEFSNKASSKIVSFYEEFNKVLPRDVAEDIFIVVSSILSSMRRKQVSKLSYTGLLVKETMRIHDSVVKALRRVAPMTVLKGDFITTILKIHQSGVNGTLSNNGCSFTLPAELGRLIVNETRDIGNIYSRMSVYENNPFVWAAKEYKIGTKVASLDFKNASGAPIKVSNLTEPVIVKLPVRHSLLMETGEHTIAMAKMNIHEFNLTKSKKSRTFIRIEEKKEGRDSDLVAIKAVVSFNEKPTERLYNRSLEFFHNAASLHLASNVGLSKVFVGVFMKPIGRVPKKTKQAQPIKYRLDVFSVSCKFWDEVDDNWSDEGCEVALESTMREAVCKCNHLTAFGAQVNVLNVSVEVKSLVSFKSNDDQHFVLAVILSVLCTYLILIMIYKFTIKSRQWDECVAYLPDNHPADLFRYLVVVETGSSHDAGTTARVSIVIYGEEGHSQIRELTCHNGKQFKRGSTDVIIMSFPDSLGDIKKIKLWHDNEGYSPNWYLKQISIVDCQTEKIWYFPWNNWLAITELTRADCQIPAEKEPHNNNVQTVFEGILDYHLWLSVFTAPGRSIFSKKQRMTLCLASLVGYMMVIAVLLANEQTVEILGYWDMKWSSVVLSLIVTAVVFPFQVILESLFRYSTDTNEQKKQTEEKPRLNEDLTFKEDQQKSQGALFFMEVNSAIYSSQNMLCKDDKDSILELKEGCPATNERQNFAFPVWFQNVWVLLCVLFSFSGMAITMWYSNRFDSKTVLLWIQALSLCFICGAGILEVLKAMCLALRKLYLVHSNAIIKMYLECARLYGKATLNQFTGTSEPNEKQILAARARARFVRFSKPILNENLRKARKKAARWNFLSSFAWNLFTTSVYITTLAMLLVHSNTREEFLQRTVIEERVTSPVKNISFNNISTRAQFFDWTELQLVDLLQWHCWHHLHGYRDASLNHGHAQLPDFNTMYTFGPACFEKLDNLKKAEMPEISNRSAYNVTAFGRKVLLIGTRNQMMAVLRLLRRSDWFNKKTSLVKISFSYFHPESSTFSYVQLSTKISPVGKLDTEVQVESMTPFTQLGTVRYVIIAFKVLFCALILISIRQELSCLMDKGLRHFQNKWNILEGLLIILTMLALSAEIWQTVEAKKTLYKIESMHINDSDVFLDLTVALRSVKVTRIIYATLFFLVLLKAVTLLRVLTRVSAILTLLATVIPKLLAFMVMFGLLFAALFHVGTLVRGRSRWAFTDSETTLLELSTVLTRGHSAILGEVAPCSSLIFAYNILASLAVFAFWLMSAIFFIGRFKVEKTQRKRRTRLLKSLGLFFKKLSSKKAWWQLYSNILKRFFGGQEDKYKSCNLPLENIYDEIEYQVEEVIFRLSNLYDMSDFAENIGKQVGAEDDYTLDSSEEAAYPSSFSTKDSISFTSESIYSEDSGYYRYGDYRGAYPSSSNSDDEYEGPVIHYLEPPRQRLGSLGQIMSPIFGGRYFVKTSWSTFRTPKVKPAEIKPPPKIQLPQSSSRKTFEKVSNWSSKKPKEDSRERLEADECEVKQGLEMFDAFPKSQPPFPKKSAKLKPLPPIQLPLLHRNKTLEKIKNCSTKFKVDTQLEDEEVSSKHNLDPCLSSHQGQVGSFDKDEKSGPKIPIQTSNLRYEQSLLPKALQSVATNIKFAPKFNENTTPFRRPKIPSVQEIMTHKKKPILFKRTQVCPLSVDTASSRSVSVSTHSLPKSPPEQINGGLVVSKTRSPSLDSGFMRSSDNEDSEVCSDVLKI
ncbi:polycystin-1-like protein 1 isoform X2 [Rhopilema esculentum]|uniref:polycystin-1-like protein 1 isoform X2 n=1 Tax=Rhopilema esculentum TaxID=499914 RepID=UPI0031D8C1FF